MTYLAVWELTRILLPSYMMPGIGHATLDLTDLVLGEIELEMCVWAADQNLAALLHDTVRYGMLQSNAGRHVGLDRTRYG